MHPQLAHLKKKSAELTKLVSHCTEDLVQENQNEFTRNAFEDMHKVNEIKTGLREQDMLAYNENLPIAEKIVGHHWDRPKKIKYDYSPKLDLS